MFDRSARFWRRWWGLLAGGTCALSLDAQAQPDVAFFYGAAPPVDALAVHRGVVLDPERAGTAAAELRERGVVVYGYVSIGEVPSNHPMVANLEPAWVLGENGAWGTRVLDPAAAGWRALLLAQLESLHARGYRAFFFDTLDSFQAHVRDPAAIAARWRAVATLIREVHARLPGVRLLLNRGFEVLPEVAPLLDGVAAESLIRGWNARTRMYGDVPPDDRKWIQARLAEVRDRYHLQAIAIDYVPPGDRELARRTAAEIVAAGFTPWVASPQLDDVGVGTVELVPRKIVALYDGDRWPSAEQSPLLRFATLPLEHLGYVLEPHDVRRGLPPPPAAGSVAGVVAWFDQELPESLGWSAWLDRTVDRKVRVALIGDPGTRRVDVLGKLGLTVSKASFVRGCSIVHKDPLVGFEGPVTPRTRDLAPIVAASDVGVHLSVQELDGTDRVTPVVTGAWGGLALAPYVLEEGWSSRHKWVVDPFAFFERALGRAEMPVPDPTTESGRRVGVQMPAPTRPPTLLPEDLLSLTGVPALRHGNDAWSRERLRQTDHPRRLRPVTLGAGVDVSELFVLSPGEFDARVADASSVQVVRHVDGRWELRHLGSVRTVRVDRSLGWPDPRRSRGVSGVRDLPQGRYVSLTGSEATLVFSQNPVATPALVESDAAVSRWEAAERGVLVELRGKEAARLVLSSAARRCSVQHGARTVVAVRKGTDHVFGALPVESGAFTITCK